MMLDIVNQAITEYGMNTDPKTQKMVDKIQKVSGLQDKEKNSKSRGKGRTGSKRS